MGSRALEDQQISPRRYDCRCGLSRNKGQVAGLPLAGPQDDGAGGRIALHNCPDCGCTFGLPWSGPVFRTEKEIADLKFKLDEENEYDDPPRNEEPDNEIDCTEDK